MNLIIQPFTVYIQLAIVATVLEKTFSTARMYQAFNHGQKSLFRDKCALAVVP